MNVPIIYSPHLIGLKKNSLDYLFVPLSFASAIKTNPGTDIYFLNVNDNYTPDIKGLNVVDVRESYTTSTEGIKKIYQHLSSNHEVFELFCIERFFVIRDFMASNGMKSAFLIETDVLLLQNLNSVFSNADFFCFNRTYLSEKKCISLAHVTFEYIQHYCDFVTDCYTNITKFSKIESYFKAYQNKGAKGGICDMTFCDYINKGLFGAKKEMIVDNMSGVFSMTNDSYFFDSFIGRDHIIDSDLKINMHQSYVDEKRIKKISFENRKATVNTTIGDLELCSIHCQGNAKALMSDYFVNFFEK